MPNSATLHVLTLQQHICGKKSQRYYTIKAALSLKKSVFYSCANPMEMLKVLQLEFPDAKMTVVETGIVIRKGK